MCRTQYVLALVALCVGLAHSFSWDFVISSGSHLDFYFNGRHTHSENITTGDISQITYDAVGNRMFYNTNTTIFSYDLTQKIESLVVKSREGESIVAIAFDPVEEKLFWIELYSIKICWFSLKPGFENNVYGNLLIQIPDDTDSELSMIVLSRLAVDSCTGYIYWINANRLGSEVPSTIERARFDDGSDREVLISGNFEIPDHLVIDQQSQKIYWSDARLPTYDEDYQPSVDTFFLIGSADLNGKNRTTFYSETGLEQVMTLAVSKDSIYWVHCEQKTLYELSKNPSIHAKPKEISVRASDVMAIATNYRISDQIRGIQNCEGLKRLLPNNSVTEDNDSANLSLSCIHGVKVSGKSQCQCTHGYTGERCDISICQNYCYQGDCIVSAEEQPTCRCNAGYSGERCEVNDCHGYCLNDGICSLNEKSEPVCQCKGYYEGERCDFSTCKCFQKVVSKLWGFMNADVTQATLDNGVNSTCALPAV